MFKLDEKKALFEGFSSTFDIFGGGSFIPQRHSLLASRSSWISVGRSFHNGFSNLKNSFDKEAA